MSVKMLTESIYEYQSLNLERCGLKITMIDQQEVVYQIQDFSFNKLKQVLIKRSLNFKLCQKIFTGEFINILEFSEEHYISIASMYRQVRMLKKILKKYHLTLNLSQHPWLKGQEYHIRHFYFELYFAAYGLTEDYLEMTHWQVEEAEESWLEGPFPVRQKIKLLYYISRTRWSQTYYMLEMAYLKPDKLLILDDNLKTFYVKQLMTVGASKSQMASELNFFLIYILNVGVLDNDKLAKINFYVSENSQELNEKYHWGRQWANLFSDFFEVALSQEVRLFLYGNLYIYFISKMFFPYTMVNYNDILVKYQKDNPFIWEKTLLFQAQLKEQYPHIIISDHLTHFFIRELIFLTSEELEICVFSSCSYSQNRIIGNEIKKRTTAQIKITRKITARTKLIVSDLDFDLARVNSSHKLERVFIQTIPSESDYQLITKMILKLSQ